MGNCGVPMQCVLLNQQIQFMFHWCQNVNVYNVENHYHFYADHEAAIAGHTAGGTARSFQKLRPAPISITTSTNGNTRRNAKSCSKKGLHLSKTLDQTFHIESVANPNYAKPNQQVQSHQPVPQGQHIRSATVSGSQIGKTRSIESCLDSQSPLPSLHNNNNSNNFFPSTPTLNQPNYYSSNYTWNEPTVMYKTQRIDSKHKPAISVSISKEAGQCKEQNNLLLTHLYSTRCNFIRSSTFTNLAATALAPKQSKQVQTENSPTEPQALNARSRNLLDISPIRSKNETPELTTSRNVCSRDRSDSHYNASQSGYGFNNSRYNVSRSQSVSMDIEHEQNQRCYYRIMEMSRGEARQASIILSNILSRSGQASYSYCSNPQKPALHPQKLAHDRQRIFFDKQTILSQNDAQSESSLKIEQSQLCDLDPRHNFTLLKNKTITNNSYTMELAIENTMRCVVSLKEIWFRDMSAISQELQMYEFLEQKLGSSDAYCNILELYQVQMSNGSYLLIKQPYTFTLFEYLQSLPTPQRALFAQEVKQMVRALLAEFADHLIYPSRMLNIIDFVVCESVVKFHDLSIFRQMKGPAYEVELLLGHLELH